MSVPVAEGLFETNAGTTRLIGSQCGGCGTVYFPQAYGCRNPDCPAPALERTLLPGHGRLVSYTIQRYQPPPLFRIDEWQPYAIGLVDFGNGVEVMGMLTGVALNAIAIGTCFTVVAEVLYVDADRGPVATYKFALEGAA